MEVARGPIFIPFVEAGIFDETVVGKKEDGSPGRKFPQARSQVELQVLKDIPEKVFQGPPLGMHSFIDAADFPEVFLPFFALLAGPFQGLLQKLHLPGRGGRQMGPERAFVHDPDLMSQGRQEIFLYVLPQIPSHPVQKDPDPLSSFRELSLPGF